MSDGDARGRTPAPVAWAYWDRWRGPPELVRHIAARALSAVGSADEQGTKATCVIEVHVKEDCETVSDPAVFCDEITSDALRRFSHICIEAQGHSGDVHVAFTRKRGDKRGSPARGVLVTATSASGNAERIREDMARAIERGTGRASRRVGDLRDQGLDVADARARVRKAVDDELSQGPFPGRGDPVGQLALSNTLAAVSAWALLVIAWQAEWIDLAEDAVSFLTYAYGASVVPLWFLLRVSVEVQASSVAQRALTWLGLGVAGALLSGLVGAALKAVGVG